MPHIKKPVSSDFSYRPWETHEVTKDVKAEKERLERLLEYKRTRLSNLNEECKFLRSGIKRLEDRLNNKPIGRRIK
jgi:hypothetical protein